MGIISLIIILYILSSALNVISLVTKTLASLIQMTEEEKKQSAIVRAQLEAKERERIARILSEPDPADLVVKLFFVVIILTGYYYALMHVNQYVDTISAKSQKA